MKPHIDCEDVRPRLMAVVDEGIDAVSAADRDHLSACRSCQDWVSDLQQMDGRLQRLAYPEARVDLWASLDPKIRQLDAQPTTRRLWIIGALMLAWRVLQLLIDLPLPGLQPLVPFAAMAAALWLLAGDSLAVKTFAPELQKRGI